jgi:small subunit ribosomal protein S6
LRRYETTFIVNPQADDAAIDRQVNSVVDLIKNNGGQILYENRMGTRRMAYPIAGLVQGYYASLIFESETGILPQLERHYQLEEPYIRYLTIRYEGPTDEAEMNLGFGDRRRERRPVEEKTPKAKAVAEESTTEKAEAAPAEAKPAETETAPAEEPEKKVETAAPVDGETVEEATETKPTEPEEL